MRFFSVLLISVLLISCGEDAKPTKPDNLISRNKMSEILYDVYILNSAKGINKKLLEVRGVFPEEYVFEKYNIDSIQFAESNDYYAYMPDDYQIIMDSVKNKIERNKKRFEELNNAEELEKKRVRDSLNEIYKKARDSSNATPRRKPGLILDSLKKVTD